MKHLLLFFLLAVGAHNAFAQKSYIQVTSEPGVAVYLNGEFKGNTTAELNGYIIQNISAGTHKIKVSKSGYLSFEENITVKAGEVFSYKVKPFTRNGVTISEEGNSAASETKVNIPTGKLSIQSVPIEIKITMPKVEGLKNIAKTKDVWSVNDISEGNYEIQFTFGGKTISKFINIVGNTTTTAFINMLDGDFTVKDPFAEIREKENNIAYFNELMRNYGLTRGLSLVDFFAKSPEAAKLANYYIGDGTYFIEPKVILKNKELTKGSRQVSIKKGKVFFYSHCVSTFEDFASARREVGVIAAKIARETNPKYAVKKEGDYYSIFEVAGTNGGLQMMLEIDVYEISKKRYEVRVSFNLINNS
ncbi:PEGA domain-containing protein [Pedobacter frigiditerrae]|uniref:PEGA domain-containing protein n=1 Tax=Pedobacter frigiditerrae TaxID=2530452 RepID=UPI00292D68E2|nr:PEGA domain-containing protein [Pedobacter frigiditerrae]